MTYIDTSDTGQGAKLRKGFRKVVLFFSTLNLRISCRFRALYLAQSGASLLEIADVLGHKQISVTKRYAHLCIEHKSSLINRVMGGI